MHSIEGVGVSPGRVIGPVQQMPAAVTEPDPGERWDPAATTVDGESARLRAAAKEVQRELQNRAANVGGDARAVVEATAMMAADPMLLKSADSQIVTGISADRAIWEAGLQVADMLKSLGGYMAERTQDVLDVRSRIVAELRGLPAPGIPAPGHPFILAAHDLAPADTAILDPARILGLVTTGGGPQSHTAILARSLGLPAVVAATGADSIENGTEIYLDGAAGTVIAEPGDTERTAAALWSRQSQSAAVFDGTGTTSDGHRVPLLANVGSGGDAAEAATAGAEGIGLLRTEFCFLNRDTEPGIEEQSEAYGAVFAQFPGRKVVIRTLDAGADKPLPFLTDTTEPNPALGIRGYRTDLTSPGVLERQLKAIAAAEANHAAEVWVMAPMVSTAAEAARFAELTRAAGLNMPGIMVEVPSAALCAEFLLREVSFASIGTNDLTQYTMAADRQLGTLAALNDPWQPAVLRLVQHTVEGARAAGSKSVGVCGEAAADPALAVVLAGLGVNTLSMTPRALAAAATVLKSIDLATAEELAGLALAAGSAADARRMVRARLPILESLGL